MLTASSFTPVPKHADPEKRKALRRAVGIGCFKDDPNRLFAAATYLTPPLEFEPGATAGCGDDPAHKAAIPRPLSL